MELGRYLVNELGFEGRGNTLGQWMAHYLAELIDRAETGSTEEIRSSARRQAFDTILKIWEKRAALPGKANPLAAYKDILKVLERMHPGRNPFVQSGWNTEKNVDRIIVEIYYGFSRLIPAILIMDSPIQESEER